MWLGAPRLAAAEALQLPAATTEIAATAPATERATRPQWAVALQVVTPSSLSLGAALGVGFGANGWQRRGVGAGVLVVGVEGQWTSAEEHTPSWAVRHDGLQALATAELTRDMGVGALTLRLGVGGLAIRERRLRHQSGRLPDGEVCDSATQRVPAPTANIQAAGRAMAPASDTCGRHRLGRPMHGRGGTRRAGASAVSAQ